MPMACHGVTVGPKQGSVEGLSFLILMIIKKWLGDASTSQAMTETDQEEYGSDDKKTTFQKVQSQERLQDQF